MRNADPRGPQGGGVWPLRHVDFDKAGFDLEFRSTMLAYSVKDRQAGGQSIGEWIYDEQTLGDVVGALCWPNDPDKRPIPGWSWVWPTILGKKPKPDNSVATPGNDNNGYVVAQAPGQGGDPLQSILPGRPGNGYDPGSGPPRDPQTGGILFVGINAGGSFGGQGAQIQWSIGGQTGLSALTGIQGVGAGSGFAGFSFGGSSSAEALSGIQGVGTGSGFAQFILPQDPYQNPFGPHRPGAPVNPGGMPGVAGPAGAGGAVGPDGQPIGQPDPATQPATGGAKQPGCGTMPPSSAKIRPIQNEQWDADTRYKELDPNMPGQGGKNDTWPKFPKGIYGLTVCGSEEKKQIELFFPTSPFLGVAVNAAGDPKTGSYIIDENKEFELDPGRKAPLQSVFWVLKKPLGGDNAIAFNLGPSGCQDTEGGYFIDRDSEDGPGPTSTGGPNPQAANTAPGAAGQGGGGTDKSKKRVVGRFSKQVGGPLWVGTSRDSHRVGKTEDGHVINKGHIWTGALFKKDDQKDGPILFEDTYKQGEDQQKVVPCHLAWDPGAKMWKIWTTTLMYPPEPPPPYPPPPYPPPSYPPGTPPSTPPTPPSYPPPPYPPDSPPPPPTPPTTPYPPVPSIDDAYQHPDGTPIGPTEGPNTYDNLVASASNTGAPFNAVNAVGPVSGPGLASTAQNYGPAAENTGTFAGASPSGAAKQNSNATSAVASAFAAQGGETQGTSPSPAPPAPPSPTPPPSTPGAPPTTGGGSGDPWAFTTAPQGTKMGANKYPGKWPGGTAPGGWVLHPPETDLRDADAGLIPPQGPVSTSWFIVGPNAWFGAGVPNLPNGMLKDGLAWGMDLSTGDLVWKSYTGGLVVADAMRLTKTGQRIRWYSGAVNYGELAHQNTGDRSYFFPDVSSSVVATQPLVNDGGGAVVGLPHLGGSGPATGFSKWGKVRCDDGVDRFIMLYI